MAPSINNERVYSNTMWSWLEIDVVSLVDGLGEWNERMFGASVAEAPEFHCHVQITS